MNRTQLAAGFAVAALPCALLASATPAAAVQTGITAAPDQPTSVARYRTARVDGFRGDSVLIRVDYRTNTNNGGSVRVVQVDAIPVYSDNDEPDPVKGNVTAQISVTTRAGAEVANLARTNLPQRFVLGTLITRGQGANVDVRLVGRGVTKSVTLQL